MEVKSQTFRGTTESDITIEVEPIGHGRTVTHKELFNEIDVFQMMQDGTWETEEIEVNGKPYRVTVYTDHSGEFSKFTEGEQQ
jgi:hypothetical protein